MARVEYGPQMELLPAFSEKARARDPVLAAEETNGLFQAFRRRRRVYGRQSGSFGDRLLYRMRRNWWATALLAVTVVLTPPLVWFLGPEFLMLAGFPAAVAVVFIVAPPGRLEANIPPYLFRSFQIGSKARTLATDLWMLGCPAEEITEALYLEMRESHRGTQEFAFGLAVLMYLILAGLLLYFCSWSCVFFLAAMVLLLRALLHWGEVSLIDMTLQQINRLYDRWMAALDFGGYVRSQISDLAVAAAWILIIGFCGVGGLIAMIAFLDSFDVSRWIPSWLWPHLSWTIAAVVTLIAAWITRAWTRRSQGRLPGLYSHVQRRACFLYNAYMASVVLADPDGLAWARATHGGPIPAKYVGVAPLAPPAPDLPPNPPTDAPGGRP
ncbi:MAG: hypothetical protein KF858_09355 [Candidatus Sumerlaeia bacterium]|nr:hypothetical protein [Candidatus Sumerlaeia bacterium]